MRSNRQHGLLSEVGRPTIPEVPLRCQFWSIYTHTSRITVIAASQAHKIETKSSPALAHMYRYDRPSNLDAPETHLNRQPHAGALCILPYQEWSEDDQEGVSSGLVIVGTTS